jgi:cold shock CspA family protein
MNHISSSAPRVFISYAREDKAFAEKLCRDLRQAGVKPWLDSVDLLPGQRWEPAIREAIRDSSYFIAVLSSRSVGKKGYVQKEIRQALSIAEEYSEDRIFIIPVRLDECEPSFEGLRSLHMTDLFLDYTGGLTQLLRVFKYESEEKPALVRLGVGVNGTISKLTDKGFGFIKSDLMANAIFFHHGGLIGVQLDELREGDAVTFETAETPKGMVAINVQRA